MAFDKRLFLILFISLFFSTIAGILFHEFGHWVGARYSGRYAKISYNHTCMLSNEDAIKMKEIDPEYESESSYVTFPPLSSYNDIANRLNKQLIFYTAGGLIFTLLASIAALILLVHSKRDKMSLTRWQWTYVLVAFFAIRCVFGPLRDIVSFAKTRQTAGRMFAEQVYLATLVTWKMWLLPLISGIIGLLIVGSAYRMVPFKQRKTFFLALIAGELTVWILWIQVLGPILLP